MILQILVLISVFIAASGAPTTVIPTGPTCNFTCPPGFFCGITSGGARCFPIEVPVTSTGTPPPVCGPNEENHYCGNFNEGKCYHVINNLPKPCVEICFPPACRCIEGYYRNNAGQCVTECECREEAAANTTPTTTRWWNKRR